ncbi:hypothetical protein AAMO2058_001285300 [Amorphochlora amoebiformis]
MLAQRGIYRSLLRCNLLNLRVSVRLFSSLPDYTELPMPALSPTMEVGTVSKWQKAEGDVINAGDVLADVETDKAVVAFESVEEGYLAKILVEEGTSDIPVGTVVALMVESEEDVPAFKDFKLESSSPPPSSTPAPEPEPTPLPPPPPLKPRQPPPPPPPSYSRAGGSRRSCSYGGRWG